MNYLQSKLLNYALTWNKSKKFLFDSYRQLLNYNFNNNEKFKTTSILMIQTFTKILTGK
jgi:hypothetical protein